MSQSLSLSPSIITRLSLAGRAELLGIKFGPITVFLLAHIAIAPALRRMAALALVHVAIVIVLGLWWAVTKRENIIRVAYIGAYITGAEVLWRMAQTPIPWEFGKYATVLIFIVAILRHQLFKIPILPLLFFVPLTFSIPFTIEGAYGGTARGIISFYISGPLALFCCAWFFSQIKLSQEQLKRMVIALIAPILSIGTATLFVILTAESIRFDTESNRMASGGFAPNQVSAVLGLGMFLSLLCVLSGQLSKPLRIVLFVVTIFLGIQGALTFSRGGLFTGFAAILVAFFYLSRNRRALLTNLLISILLFGIVNYIVLPQLDAFTGGAITERFQKTSLTGRDELIRDELEIFLNYPALGVGPGMSEYYHYKFRVGSHTEYSRLLAEHGLFGLSSILILLVSIWLNLRKEHTNLGKAIVASFSLWSLLFMSSAAMRLVAPAFIFGVGFATILPGERSRFQLVLQRLQQLRKRLTRQRII
jgi:hypothetical protein